MIKIYKKLLKHFGPQGWWPIGGVYDPLRVSLGSMEKFEVAAGAILTQNSSWANAEKALGNLRSKGCLSPEKISAMDLRTLEKLVHPSGFFRQKARRLKNLSKYFMAVLACRGVLSRKELLSLDGVGSETADSILLYAFGEPYFIADAYTRRFASRTGVFKNGNYESVGNFFESNLPKDVGIYKEYHALIVALAKKFCRKKPVCTGCPVRSCCSSRPSIKASSGGKAAG